MVGVETGFDVSGRPLIVIGFDTPLSCGETIFPAFTWEQHFLGTPFYVLAPKLATGVLVVIPY